MTNWLTKLAATAALLVAAPAMGAEMTDGPLTISAELPQTVRVGDEFTYNVTVTNSSDNLTLHDIKIRQTGGEQVSIEQAQVKGQQNQNQNQNRQQAQQGQQSQASGEMIEIASLDPGQSQTVAVTAAADAQGPGNVCLMVESYTPALCLGLEATKPELDLVKKAPDEVNLCEPFVYTYTFKNDGTGSIDGITLTDELPEGVVTIAGDKSLSFDVSGLAAGDSRTFEANVMALRTGTFSTRAMAKAGEDLKSRSSAPETRVIAPKVALKLEGPDEVYIDTPANYTVRVTNTGDAIARDTQVAVKFPNAAGFARVSDVRQADQKVNGGQAKGNKSIAMVRPRLAMKDGEIRRQNAGQNDNDNALALDDEENFDFGDLQPGESKEIVFSMSPQEQGTYGQVAQVSYYCAIADEADLTSSRLSAEAYNSTEVIALPALLLAVYDNEEKNRGDGKITYRVVVKNQGEAKDTNLTLTGTLPEGLKFVSGDGPTNVSADGQTITIDKVNTIRPGDRMEWDIQTEVQKGAGDVRFKMEMNADSLTKPATAEEPTRLLDLAARN